MDDEWISFNVGGQIFTTTRATLVGKEPTCMLARMFSRETEDFCLKPGVKDASGAYLLDRSPKYFEPLLNYLRTGNLVLDQSINPRGVLEEAKYFGIESMIPLLEAMQPVAVPKDQQPLTRRDVVEALIQSPCTSPLRFQGANLENSDMEHINLRVAKLRNANVRNCDLRGACLAGADLEGCDLSGSDLQEANLRGANLDNCSLEAMKNETGVNLKGANLENSDMEHINLRVAKLRNANVRNCDLRGACLAGADLEGCDLSGSDLQEANLRGANLDNCSLEAMVTPIHMSQTTLR
ncbi:unnamed protein product [Notodromas monacha]|uniref:BTB domain-containing protein n=1 Tax=Notodromas monacha TaxID=399045 RepID=A0A7R9BQC1_9CRUS|nr:unnamed protein product [Notodromas monacha]CAG0919504.1 unnamed protein product [Notodromas monacha]